MKTQIFISLLLLATISVFSQVKYESDESLHIYRTSSSATKGNIHIHSSQDLRFGDAENGDWSIEHWDGGLNIFKEFPSQNAGPYKLFINDANGYVGVGLKPDGLFQISRPSSSNYKGILMGYLGNDIQGRYGTYQGRQSAYNGDLVLNYWAGNVGIGKSNPAYKLDVNGDIATYGTLRITSDKRLKKNIKDIDNALERILEFKGVSYEFDRQLTVNDTLEQSEELNIKRQFGFIAQDVQNIQPDLVLADRDNYLTVDYISVIPLLVEALKEQQQQIEEFKKVIKNEAKSVINNNSGTVVNEVLILESVLYQNNPNPFSEDTEIKYLLSEDIKTAVLYIYNMQGNQIKNIPLNNRGEGSINIHGSELQPGMYLYTLIADGKEIDTKRMILTD